MEAKYQIDLSGVHPSSTYTTFTKPFCAHFAQFLSSLAFDKKTGALQGSFLVPTFVYRHRFISLGAYAAMKVKQIFHNRVSVLPAQPERPTHHAEKDRDEGAPPHMPPSRNSP
jgi:hypothetical protein